MGQILVLGEAYGRPRSKLPQDLHFRLLSTQKAFLLDANSAHAAGLGVRPGFKHIVPPGELTIPCHQSRAWPRFASIHSTSKLKGACKPRPESTTSTRLSGLILTRDQVAWSGPRGHGVSRDHYGQLLDGAVNPIVPELPETASRSSLKWLIPPARKLEPYGKSEFSP